MGYAFNIAKAIEVAHSTVYKIRVNLDIYGESYAPASVVQGRPRLLLAYQELVSLRACFFRAVAGQLTAFWSPNRRRFGSQTAISGSCFAE